MGAGAAADEALDTLMMTLALSNDRLEELGKQVGEQGADGNDSEFRQSGTQGGIKNLDRVHTPPWAHPTCIASMLALNAPP